LTTLSSASGKEGKALIYNLAHNTIVKAFLKNALEAKTFPTI